MDTPPPAVSCPGCETEVLGRYCHECGQEQGPLLPSVRAWLASVLDEVLFVEARLPRTLRLLVLRPGFLTREWGAGRRSPYVAPLRLYLAAAAVFFVVWPLAAESQSALFQGMLEGYMSGYLRGAGGNDLPPDAVALAAGLADRIVTWLQVLLLVGAVPVLALVNLGDWGERSDSFVQQLIFSLHFHTVGFALLVVWVLMERAWAGGIDDNIQFLILFGYLAVVIRGAFGTTWRVAIVRGVAVGLTYALVSLVLVLALAGLSAVVWPVSVAS
ncbi:MAG: hypothetical protein AMXMBFR53_07220 [Gemmatimonadota bacterium]